VTIANNIQFSLGRDTAVCRSNPLVTLRAPVVPGARYNLTLNGTVISTSEPPYVAVDSGNYRLSIVSSSGCQWTDDINVSFVPAPQAAFESEPSFSPSVRVTESNPVVQFINNSQTATRYLWDFGDTTTSTQRDPLHRFPRAGIYFVKLYAFNGSCVDSITRGPINVVRESEVEFPSAFSPNNDGRNDDYRFQPVEFQEYEMVIFDRWGNIKYQKEFNAGPVVWNGNDKNGNACVEGVYVFRFKGRKWDGSMVVEGGTITLIR
jgi:gliding motility-associated-like protein